MNTNPILNPKETVLLAVRTGKVLLTSGSESPLATLKLQTQGFLANGFEKVRPRNSKNFELVQVHHLFLCALGDLGGINPNMQLAEDAPTASGKWLAELTAMEPTSVL